MDAWGFPQSPPRPDDPWTGSEVATRGHRATEGADGAAVVDIRHGYLPAAEALWWVQLPGMTLSDAGSSVAWQSGSGQYEYDQIALSVETYDVELTGPVSSSEQREGYCNLVRPLQPSGAIMLSLDGMEDASGFTVQGYWSGSGKVYVDELPTSYSVSITWALKAYGIENTIDLGALAWGSRPMGDYLGMIYPSRTISKDAAAGEYSVQANLLLRPSVIRLTNPSTSKVYRALRIVSEMSYSYTVSGDYGDWIRTSGTAEFVCALAQLDTGSV